jgi:hypothetical protein
MNERQVSWKGYLLHIVAWLGSTALVLADVVMIRYVVVDVMGWLTLRQAAALRQQGHVGRTSLGWTIEAVDRGMLLILACAGIALAVVFDYYYRDGLRRGVFGRRVAKVVAIELGIIGLGLLLQVVL